MCRFAAVLLILAFSAGAALAQSGCEPLYQGNVLTPLQWQACFGSKQDKLGFSPVSRNGDTMNGRLVTYPPATTAGFNLTPGSVPGSPANGDVWVTPTGVYARAGDATYWLTGNWGRLRFVSTSVNFNPGSATDTVIALALPPGSTRYSVEAIRISNASHSLTTATAGVFTAAAAGGVAVVSTGAITVTNGTDATANNMQALSINNLGTITYTLAGQPNLYFRVVVSEGAAATADVTVTIIPLP